MEVEVLKDKYNYKFYICTNCESELKVKKDDMKFYYKNGFSIADILCPCCNKKFIVH